MNDLLQKLVRDCRPLTRLGRPAGYIPALAGVDPQRLGVAVATADGAVWAAGDSAVPFTIQSISKVFTLMVALADRGEEELFARIGKEPTGDPFNSIVRLETDSPKKPYNPMINAGAITAVSLVAGADPRERFARLLEFMRALAGNPHLACNEAVFASERATGHRNRALAYFLQDLGVLQGEVGEVLEVYFRQCAVEMTCQDLARAALALALDGQTAAAACPPVTRRIARIAKTFMFTCGLYEESGEFAIAAGIPAKSGVGGGIMAVVPGRMGIGVFGPALDEKGNSIAGKKLLEDLAQALDLGIV